MIRLSLIRCSFASAEPRWQPHYYLYSLVLGAWEIPTPALDFSRRQLVAFDPFNRLIEAEQVPRTVPDDEARFGVLLSTASVPRRETDAMEISKRGQRCTMYQASAFSPLLTGLRKCNGQVWDVFREEQWDKNISSSSCRARRRPGVVM